jgi:hypothetical protein
MNARILLSILFVVILAGCSDSLETQQSQAFISDAEYNQREKTKYLAYEHHLVVELGLEEIRGKYEEILSFCGEDEKFSCTILESSLSSSDFSGSSSSSADIRLRIKPTGVKSLFELASNKGRTSHQSTKIDDLAKDVIDTEKRLSMLTAHRDRLIELQQTESADIDALLKIAKELASVQSELEQTAGKEQYLLKRINMDLVTISYRTTHDRQFWAPIIRAAKNFFYELSDGISSAIGVVAYSIPFFLLLITALVILIKVWRRLK